MPNYQTPGVYYEATDLTRGGITAIRTDIAAFVGLAERGPLNRPWPVESYRQFQTLFGDLMAGGYLAYCVKAFFENGGRRCYIVRVAHSDAARAWGELVGADGNPTLRIQASSEGCWGNALAVRLTYSQPAASQTYGPQEPSGAQSSLDSVVGFPAGTLVRLFQRNAGGDLEMYRVVAGVDPAGRSLLWDAPLEVLPASVPGFDLALPVDLESVSFTLTVYEGGQLRALYPDLSPAPGSERYVVDMINPSEAELEKRQQFLPLIEVEDLHAGAVNPLWADWLPDVQANTASFTGGMLSLSCGLDGLANLEAADFTGSPVDTGRRGLRTLELEEEVSLVAVPDILIRPIPPVAFAPLPEPEIDPCLCTPPSKPHLPPLVPCPDTVEQPPAFDESQILWVQQQLVLHCEQLADRFALLDPPMPQGPQRFDPSQALSWRQQFDTSFAALYYPWVLAPDPLRLEGQVVRAIPPSGHIAGVIARTDLSAGVHRAPANAVLSWVQGFSAEIDDAWQGVLNPAHVNCLRNLPGRGLRVYGARTLSSDTALRFVSVRRLLLMIEKALRISLDWSVFEPHDFYLRQTILMAISSFLSALRKRGALAGSTPDTAFFVRCDEQNNPSPVVEAGQLIIDVGVAPVQPAEFIVFRIGRRQDELEITELERVQL